MNHYDGGLSLLNSPHPHHFIILHQHHVVSAEGSNENDTGDPLKAMDPLLSFGTLTTHIEHPAGEEHSEDTRPLGVS